MCCLIIGTDNLGKAAGILEDKFGIKKILHWNGRQKKLPSRLPSGVDIVLVYTGFIQHHLMWRVRELAKKVGIPVKYVSRGLSSLASYPA